jgi:nicotinamide mononucleotide transporter
MPQLLSVETVAFTVLGYPLSWIELSGTLLYLASVWLIARQHILTWPVGILSVLLYMVLFYQIRLYADALEQVYYLAASAFGWWRWSTRGAPSSGPLRVHYSPARCLLFVLLLTAVLSVALGMVVARLHQLLPALFPEPASFPYVDAATTVMSFTAMALMALKRIESWLYWIVVDVVGIGLYAAKDVRFVALLYAVLLVLAVHGHASWRRAGAQARERLPG